MIVVHIGPPKTGSSTIQTFLDAHDEALRALSIDYPRLGRLNRKAHYNLVHELMGRSDRFDPQSGTMADLVEHLRTSAARTAILSAETLASCDDDAVRRFGNAVLPLGRPVRIVMIVRDLIELAPSSYAQKTREGSNISDFDVFLNARLALDAFDVLAVARRWADVFGWRALRVRALDACQLVNADLIDDFLATAGLNPDEPALRALARDARVNVSAGWKTVEAVRALFTGESGLPTGHPLIKLVDAGLPYQRKRRLAKIAEEVADAFDWNRDRGHYLTGGQAERLLAGYLASLNGLNDKLAGQIPKPPSLNARGFVERDYLPAAAFIPADALQSFYDALSSSQSVRTLIRRAARNAT